MNFKDSLLYFLQSIPLNPQFVPLVPCLEPVAVQLCGAICNERQQKEKETLKDFKR